MIENVSPLVGTCGSVATVRVGVFDALDALIADTAPWRPAVVVLVSKSTFRPTN